MTRDDKTTLETDRNICEIGSTIRKEWTRKQKKVEQIITENLSTNLHMLKKYGNKLATFNDPIITRVNFNRAVDTNILSDEIVKLNQLFRKIVNKRSRTFQYRFTGLKFIKIIQLPNYKSMPQIELLSNNKIEALFLIQQWSYLNQNLINEIELTYKNKRTAKNIARYLRYQNTQTRIPKYAHPTNEKIITWSTIGKKSISEIWPLLVQEINNLEKVTINHLSIELAPPPKITELFDPLHYINAFTYEYITELAYLPTYRSIEPIGLFSERCNKSVKPIPPRELKLKKQPRSQLKKYYFYPHVVYSGNMQNLYNFKYDPPQTVEVNKHTKNEQKFESNNHDPRYRFMSTYPNPRY